DCVGFWVNQAINHWPNAPYISELYSEIFTEETYLISPIYLLTYFTLYTTEFSGFLLALNRFTTLYYPAKSELLWRQHFKKILFLFVTIPLSVCVHLIVCPVKFECSAYRDCYFDAINLFYIPGRMRVRSSIFSISFSFLTLILNLWSICSLALLRRKSDKANRKLLIYTVSVFLVILVLSIEQVSLEVAIGPGRADFCGPA
uniref:Serpentine receptor class gamma n=1 Tax=Bursaphelenchus xylophilus TaxID=6326 RepID=A0A1I7SNI0_BURXY